MKLWPPDNVPSCPSLRGGMVVKLKNHCDNYLVIATSQANQFYLINISTISYLETLSMLYKQKKNILSSQNCILVIESIWSSCQEFYKDNP